MTLLNGRATFIFEFNETLNSVHQGSMQAYIGGYFNIDLLGMNMNTTCKTFLDNVTRQRFYSKISRPTRISVNSHTLILTNNQDKYTHLEI